MDLGKPEVERCSFDTEFGMPAMDLRWTSDTPGIADRNWYLPDSVSLKGPAPRRFGVTVHRHGKNSYAVRVLWNRLCLSWNGLTSSQIMASSLALILAALGTDLWALLNQPVEETVTARAA